MQRVDPQTWAETGLLHQNIVQSWRSSAQIRTSIMQAGIDVTHHNQQLTSQKCRQRALFRMGGKCIAYMNQSFLVTTPPSLPASVSSGWKKKSMCITSITLLSPYLSVILSLSFTLFVFFPSFSTRCQHINDASFKLISKLHI